MTTSTRPYARYTGLVGATGRAEVRTISGLPTRCHLDTTVATKNVFEFQSASENFGKIAPH